MCNSVCLLCMCASVVCVLSHYGAPRVCATLTRKTAHCPMVHFIVPQTIITYLPFSIKCEYKVHFLSNIT